MILPNILNLMYYLENNHEENFISRIINHYILGH